MIDSPAFTTVCNALEDASSLDRLEARGTVRLTLRGAGLEAWSVTASQLRIVVEKLLPSELERRGVDAGVVSSLVAALGDLQPPR